MHPEEIRQAVKLFDTADKWNAFLALSAQKDNLRNEMQRGAYERIKNHYYIKSNSAPEWSYKPLNPVEISMSWYLTEFGENSICLVLGWGGQLVLEARGGDRFNLVGEAGRLLKHEKFGLLFTCLRVDAETDGQYLAGEEYNFSFGSANDGRFNGLSLAWYAHYHPEEFLTQVVEKISRFQTPEMTALLIELNQLTRK